MSDFAGWEAGRRDNICAGEQPGARFDSSIEKCSKQQDKRGNAKARPKGVQHRDFTEQVKYEC